jgi:DNA-binding transcriptional ArsR family regulator
MNVTGSPFSIAEIGALIGDPARANILLALVGGQALTAGELAWCARVTAQTASGHLAKLTEAGLLAVKAQGRHRYFRLASPLVAQMLETMQVVASIQSPPRHRPKTRIDEALQQGRTCYDHLAGRLGVALCDALVANNHVVLETDAGAATDSGSAFFERFGITLNPRRCFCKPCLDWSERRPHLAGALGAGLMHRCLDLGWIERVRDTRAVRVTDKGWDGLGKTFGIGPDAIEPRRDAA